ncbi:hypothetical protein C2G38_2224932 [Gigaspora rosea]|uniref:Uncharacterized protein n=1 Tax=Gigaspora rosea TaxID=44941 RepID=A0A397U843_9GLOM|nr:hypothetical protein C2G38_2224932 [Gigaspora rosea]
MPTIESCKAHQDASNGGPEYKGKFDPAVAKALGVNQSVADLVNGKSDCSGWNNYLSKPSSAQAICITTPELATYQMDNKDLQPRIIIYMLGNSVLKNEKYQSWKTICPNTEKLSGEVVFCDTDKSKEPEYLKPVWQDLSKKVMKIFDDTADPEFETEELDEHPGASGAPTWPLENRRKRFFAIELGTKES